MKIIPPPTASSAWDRFIPRCSDVIEPGFESIGTIARQQGFTQSYVSRRLREAELRGEVESRLFRIGNRKPVVHYRPINHEKTQTPRRQKHRRHR